MGADHTDADLTGGADRIPIPVDPDTPPARPLHLQLPALGLVFVGGVAGTGMRYLLEELFPTVGTGWPWATFGVNLAGAFILGVILEVIILAGPDSGWRQRVRLLVGTGFCGSLTTYSTFALETTHLGQHGAVGIAIAYVVTSVAAGIACAWLGIVAAGSIFARRMGAVS
ncbi:MULTISPECIES: fluoride efflux transporter CrcB [unclassified Gordonia (in: high G+C Gram-positive bacteria)]